jgi:hypothetical protein
MPATFGMINPVIAAMARSYRKMKYKIYRRVRLVRPI